MHRMEKFSSVISSIVKSLAWLKSICESSWLSTVSLDCTHDLLAAATAHCLVYCVSNCNYNYNENYNLKCIITWKLNYNYHLQLCNNHNYIRTGSKVPQLTRTKTIVTNSCAQLLFYFFFHFCPNDHNSKCQHKFNFSAYLYRSQPRRMHIVLGSQVGEHQHCYAHRSSRLLRHGLHSYAACAFC